MRAFDAAIGCAARRSRVVRIATEPIETRRLGRGVFAMLGAGRNFRNGACRSVALRGDASNDALGACAHSACACVARGTCGLSAKHCKSHEFFEANDGFKHRRKMKKRAESLIIPRCTQNNTTIVTA